MKKIQLFGALVAVGAMLTGCQFYARSAEDYSKETTKLLNTKKDEIKSCYDGVIKENKDAAGTVVIDFTVEAKTGAIVGPKYNGEKSKGKSTEALAQCIIGAMEGLKLDPPDSRTGQASFAYEFKQNEPKQL